MAEMHCASDRLHLSGFDNFRSNIFLTGSAKEVDFPEQTSFVPYFWRVFKDFLPTLSEKNVCHPIVSKSITEIATAPLLLNPSLG